MKIPTKTLIWASWICAILSAVVTIYTMMYVAETNRQITETYRQIEETQRLNQRLMKGK
jgi:cell division protein FtsL